MAQQRKIFLFNDSLLCYNSDSGLLNRYTGRSFFKKIPDENNTGDFISDLCVASDKPVVVIIDSVILAGVYDIKNLKLKIRPEEQHQYNSPWNIAAQFDVNAVKMLLRETNTLFDDMRKKLDEFPNMRTVITALLFFR